LKESDETKYWIGQLHSLNYLLDKEYESIMNDVMEIIFLLNAIIKKTKENGLK